MPYLVSSHIEFVFGDIATQVTFISFQNTLSTIIVTTVHHSQRICAPILAHPECCFTSKTMPAELCEGANRIHNVSMGKKKTLTQYNTTQIKQQIICKTHPEYNCVTSTTMRRIMNTSLTSAHIYTCVLSKYDNFEIPFVLSKHNNLVSVINADNKLKTGRTIFAYWQFQKSPDKYNLKCMGSKRASGHVRRCRVVPKSNFIYSKKK